MQKQLHEEVVQWNEETRKEDEKTNIESEKNTKNYVYLEVMECENAEEDQIVQVCMSDILLDLQSKDTKALSWESGCLRLPQFWCVMKQSQFQLQQQQEQRGRYWMLEGSHFKCLRVWWEGNGMSCLSTHYYPLWHRLGLFLHHFWARLKCPLSNICHDRLVYNCKEYLWYEEFSYDLRSEMYNGMQGQHHYDCFYNYYRILIALLVRRLTKSNDENLTPNVLAAMVRVDMFELASETASLWQWAECVLAHVFLASLLLAQRKTLGSNVCV
ncbi:hypothetical protein RFI_02912 [Reticulomyxa filosa]|uniref:Uncharacterized protein n=1 Tax=Reticulomyxa filosa TaxID=46433 RepID=X6P7U1_RETFI|nr:hypothetical protein RFI_02912 [Reticulomyxa filosa]|eukprot:ETO34183.1 hypothetical protein RFI_02912 [Reticulomyxa filosa]